MAPGCLKSQERAAQAGGRVGGGAFPGGKEHGRWGRAPDDWLLLGLVGYAAGPPRADGAAHHGHVHRDDGGRQVPHLRTHTRALSLLLPAGSPFPSGEAFPSPASPGSPQLGLSRARTLSALSEVHPGPRRPLALPSASVVLPRLGRHSPSCLGASRLSRPIPSTSCTFYMERTLLFLSPNKKYIMVLFCLFNLKHSPGWWGSVN